MTYFILPTTANSVNVKATSPKWSSTFSRAGKKAAANCSQDRTCEALPSNPIALEEYSRSYSNVSFSCSTYSDSCESRGPFDSAGSSLDLGEIVNEVPVLSTPPPASLRCFEADPTTPVRSRAPVSSTTSSSFGADPAPSTPKSSRLIRQSSFTPAPVWSTTSSSHSADPATPRSSRLIRQSSFTPGPARIRCGNDPMPTPLRRGMATPMRSLGRQASCPALVTQVDGSLRSVLVRKSSSKMTYKDIKGSSGSSHSYSHEETAAFAEHINTVLADEEVVSHLCPIHGDDLLEACADGVIMCLLALRARGDADRVDYLNTGADISIFQATENCNKAIEMAKELGCNTVNIGAQDLTQAKPTLTLSMLWSLIRADIMGNICFRGFPELIYLKLETESTATFEALPAEKLLLRWVNHQLFWAMSDRRIKNFKRDLADGVVYLELLTELSNSNPSVQLQFTSALEVAGTFTDPDKARHRIDLALAMARALGVTPFTKSDHVVHANERLNIAFVAQLFNAFPNLRPMPKIKQGALKLQAIARGAACRRTLQKRTDAAVHIQCFARAIHARKARRTLLENSSATKLQCAIRQYRARTAREERRIAKAAAIRVQCVIRARRAVTALKLLKAKRCASVRIQCVYRQRTARHALEEKKIEYRAATRLQAFFRQRKARAVVCEKRAEKSAVTVLQCLVRAKRSAVLVQRKRVERSSAVAIQTSVRGLVARRYLMRAKTSATTIEAVVRGHIGRSNAQHVRIAQNRRWFKKFVYMPARTWLQGGHNPYAVTYIAEKPDEKGSRGGMYVQAPPQKVSILGVQVELGQVVDGVCSVALASAAAATVYAVPTAIQMGCSIGFV